VPPNRNYPLAQNCSVGVSANGQGLAMGWNRSLSSRNKSKIEKQKMMKIKKADKSSFAGTEVQQSTNADVQHVSQPIAKPNVVRSFLSAQELRIGNIVTDEFYDSFKTLITVENINKEGINLFIDDDGNYPELAAQWIAPSYPFAKLRGIPLTEELLKQCGFELNVLKAKHNNIIWYGNHIGIKGMLGVVKPMEIEYIHQLQNLYFSLTGCELKISLK
jgi:hypothetical protein